ncbi:DUF6644 family protein [Aurantivibrio infirmus]
MFKGIVTWMEASWIGVAGRDIYWFFPAAEVVHFFGLCLLLGSIIIIDLRVLGFAKKIPLEASLKLIPVAIFGLVLNLLSGIVFLCTYPENYFPAAAFQLKMLAIVVGGLNAFWFKWVETPKLTGVSDTADVGFSAKFSALLSLSIWLLVIVIGRFLPYVSFSSS